MKENRFKYNFINIVVILIAAVLFLQEYGNIEALFQNAEIGHVLILILAVVLVHTVKAGRLYLTLYGTDIDRRTYMKLYCKITPVSVIFPYKLGEFFRMYCYGYQLGSLLKGVVIILLDRFMDTIALVTMILGVWLINGGQIAYFVYGLLIFLAFLLLVYFAFPGVYRFWKKYILRARATEHRLAVLKILDMLNIIYQEITNVSKGRGMLLYCLSLLAWGVEIGSIALLSGLRQRGELTQNIFDYLMSAMGTEQTVELKQFVFISVILLIAVYLLIKLAALFRGKKVCK